MKKYRGLIANIGIIDGDAYILDIDNERLPLSWTDDMLEPVIKISDKVIFNDKATILFLNGKKYIAKCDEEDTYDKEKGLLLCLAKSIGYGYDAIKKMIENAKDYNKKD